MYRLSGDPAWQAEPVEALVALRECKGPDPLFARLWVFTIGSLLGKVRVERVNKGAKTTAEGDDFCLSTVRKGEMFGIMSFLDGSRHSATIIADDDTRLLVLKKEDFDRYLESNAVIYGKVVKGIATHLATIVRSMNAQYMDLMHLMFRKSK
ncbi:MAG: cyclic nucleotide-binding domain-containing protein [Nitrospirales bacterium]|nr:cyclic nucleotide-binding domain-containing protein [Nitrospirales bacterium]